VLWDTTRRWWESDRGTKLGDPGGGGVVGEQVAGLEGP